jgi:hypothetical protein
MVMKQFVIWCAIFVGVWAGLSGAYHLYLTRNPRKVLVLVDTSFGMHTVWAQMPEVVERFRHRRYTVFSLITDKARLHSWQARLTLGNITPYAPRALAKMVDRQRYPEIDAADQVYIVTNASDIAALPDAKEWHVVQLCPLAP